jgi:FdhD protein
MRPWLVRGRWSDASRRVVSSTASRGTAERFVLVVRDGAAVRRPDQLVGEEPLEIRVNGQPISVTMRTPGNDFELAVGFCLTEGIVDRPDQVATARYCAGEETGRYNVVDVRLRDPSPVAASLRRNVYTASSCGICGTAAIEAVRKEVASVADDPLCVSAETLAALPKRLRAAQRLFERTGGLHAAGLFDADGELRCLREDVGRHNAVDKVVGWAAMANTLPLAGHMLLVSGRVAFEIVQKALRAGIPFVAAVSAPSDLAVSLAEDAGMTVVGFLRGDSMNVYTGAHRLSPPPSPRPSPPR